LSSYHRSQTPRGEVSTWLGEHQGISRVVGFLDIFALFVLSSFISVLFSSRKNWFSKGLSTGKIQRERKKGTSNEQIKQINSL